MKKILTIVTLMVLSCWGLTSCDDGFDEWGYVNFYIDPNSTEYYNLNQGTQGWEYFYGGNRGVIIFRLSYYDFMAFERSCVVEGCKGTVEVDPTTNLTMHCPSCGADYICVDGSPLAVEGNRAKRALFSYCNHYDGMYLYVFNCGN